MEPKLFWDLEPEINFNKHFLVSFEDARMKKR